MNCEIIVHNYWKDKGYKSIFSDGIKLPLQRTFRKIHSSFPSFDESVSANFKAVWIFQCEKSGATFLGWIYSSGKLPERNICVPVYQSVIINEEISIDKIISLLKHGPANLYSAQDSAGQINSMEESDFFSENDYQFQINEKFVEILKEQKLNEKLLRAWSENTTSYIATELRSEKSFGTWKSLDKNIAEMSFDELTDQPLSVKKIEKEQKPNRMKGRLIVVIISTLLAIAAWLIIGKDCFNNFKEDFTMKNIKNVKNSSLVNTNLLELNK